MRRFLPVGPVLLGALAALVAAPALTAGCVGRTELEVIPRDAGSDAPVDAAPEAGPPPIKTATTVDLLLVVDNSPNTENFQSLLAATVPYLVGRFAQPACVNGLGNVVATTATVSAPCPDGQREFQPVNDVHLGVVTSSLGGHGADSCSPASPFWNVTQNDAAHLLTRGPAGTVVPTYGSLGFLAWDPSQKDVPPGESDLGALGADLADLITGAGAQGCGFEATLESMYRFLVDPEPYLTLPVIAGLATPTDTDTTVLQQRADFLRPTSALEVLIITDEDDCSTIDSNENYLSLQALDPSNPSQAFHLPPPRAECAQNPADPCCASCGQATPAGCPTDPSCAVLLDETTDPINLRCFDQKRRFGIDFLYPVQRYIDGLTELQVARRDGTLVPNPLYTGNRSPELVMVTGIVGVPWQDVAKAPKSLATGYQPADEIDWGLIVDDPAKGTLPSDPLMIKSVTPRTGVNPPTGLALAPPGSALLANAINGHERAIAEGDDLQYACVYARPTPVTCTANPCNCVGPDLQDNPVCQAMDGTYGTTEFYARALPSTRILHVLQGLGTRATVASVCAEITADATTPTYAYKPAVDAMLRTLRPRLQ